jgi:hypothetical protein
MLGMRGMFLILKKEEDWHRKEIKVEQENLCVYEKTFIRCI